MVYIKEQLGRWVSPEGHPTKFKVLHHGRMMKISKGKAQCREFFLFDHLLIYCKRDKKKLELKGDLPMSELSFKDVPDGKIKHGSQPIINALEINNYKKNKWYTCYCYSSEEKKNWYLFILFYFLKFYFLVSFNIMGDCRLQSLENERKCDATGSVSHIEVTSRNAIVMQLFLLFVTFSLKTAKLVLFSSIYS